MVAHSDEEVERPGPHPPPPEHGFQNSLPLVVARPPWFRSHSVAHDAIFFGRSGNSRFADPVGSYGILYIGEDAECAFIETFGQALGSRTIQYDDLAARTLSIISASRPVTLVDITGPGLAHIGADARLFAGEHRVSQLWSRAFYDHQSQPDGILYRARHDPSRRAIALFERADLELWSTPLGFDILSRVLATYRFALLP
jgi:RES domain